MRKAILHIGCEKTGSTSIQSHLRDNEKRLGESGFTYSTDAGLVSNFKLVLFAQSSPDQDLLELAGVESSKESIQNFKSKFCKAHAVTVNAFHRRHPNESTAIYSSEHCQSRLTQQKDVQVLKDFLDDLYDCVEVVVYIRRQDKFASSAHNTSIQGGNTKRFRIDTIRGTGIYYDHYSMLELWASVFDKNAITVRVFEPNRLHKKSVVADFCKIIGWSDIENQHEDERSNERLTYSAQEVLLEFNRTEDGAAVLRGHSKSALRKKLVQLLHSWNDEHGSMKPSREKAIMFYGLFREKNKLLADKWLSGKGFDENFDDYPEVEKQLPAINAIRLLDNAIGECLGEVSNEEASRKRTAGDSV